MRGLHDLKINKDKYKGKYWVPKALGIISRYDYYDYYNRMLETLVDKLHSGYMFVGKTLEHYIFTMVFEVPNPRPGLSANFENIKMTLPAISELPFTNTSHYDKLLNVMQVEDIVRIFTSLLFEERVLLIMDKKEDLLPVSYALQSLIYPFELCIFIPYLANDSANEDDTNLNHVQSPISYMIGIIEKDKALALKILKSKLEFDEDYTSPHIIDLSSSRDKDLDPIYTIDYKDKERWLKPLTKEYIKEASLPAQEEGDLLKTIRKIMTRKEDKETLG